MAVDFKKEYKEYYTPAARPSIVTVPPMNYIAVRGDQLKTVIRHPIKLR